MIVHIPSHYKDTQATALILNLHGSGSDARQQELFSGMDATADADTFIVAYPQGLIASGTGFDWNIPGVPLFGGAKPPASAANDITFLTGLVQTLEGRYCIDSHRVFATGVSGGGRMSSQLACDASSTFAAVAPVAGLRYPSPCPTKRDVPVIAFHGTADPVDPFNGNGQAYWTYSVPVAAQRWATHDGCKPAAKVSHAKGYTLTSYSGCGSLKRGRALRADRRGPRVAGRTAAAVVDHRRARPPERRRQRQRPDVGVLPGALAEMSAS